MRSPLIALGALALSSCHHADAITTDDCHGYSLSRVTETHSSITADLDLIGSGCGIYGPDIPKLSLTVEYQTDSRLHVLIQDRDAKRYQVPDDVVPRPKADASDGSAHKSDLAFEYTKEPFTFQVKRKSTGEVLFDTSETSLIFESQYLRLKTWLPEDPNIYGIGEHTDSFRLPNEDYSRTLWARDMGGVPHNENLYGSHPVYFEHRTTGTHGVLLLNSNGMDVKLQKHKGRNSLEYNVIGGVLDLYFMAGPSPIEVSRQYAALVGTPAMIPYWSLGFHQCKYGYQDWFEVAEVITNYSAAGIPLETMWTDIDYMDRRRIFSLDPERFPLERMREIVQYLHDRQQQFILMVDPAVAEHDDRAYHRGVELDTFLKDPRDKDSIYRGVVWPGVTVFPDWFHANATEYWVERFAEFFHPETGVDIDGVWIDMNEPSNFCPFPCDDPDQAARDMHTPPEPPPVREPPRSLPGFSSSISSSSTSTSSHSSQTSTATKDTENEAPAIVPDTEDDAQAHLELRDVVATDSKDKDDVLHPPYKINNHNSHADLSDKTVRTDIVHAGDHRHYDTHNLFGLMMGMATRKAMLSRRPLAKPFIVTRSSFVSAGKYMQKWLGDNLSTWDHYRASIAGMLGFASIYQVPMVGSDVCGFGLTAEEKMCARWTTLAAFQPFYRNHADDYTPRQEFYLWPLVTEAAKYAIAVRYMLLDYFYTALYDQSLDGTPAINPLWYLYPDDENTYAVDLQYFYGNCLLVSPVTDEGAKDVKIYLPKDVFYDFETGHKVHGKGEHVHVEDVPWDRIPLHVRGGCVLPLRVESANTTTELRKKSFELLVAPGLDGKADGTLFVDDGVSLDGGENQVGLNFRFEEGHVVTTASQHATPGGDEDLQDRMAKAGVKIEKIRVLGRPDGSGEMPYKFRAA